MLYFLSFGSVAFRLVTTRVATGSAAGANSAQSTFCSFPTGIGGARASARATLVRRIASLFSPTCATSSSSIAHFTNHIVGSTDNNNNSQFVV